MVSSPESPVTEVWDRFVVDAALLDPGLESLDIRARLQEMLQAALQVEFSTIPPYLAALYSIKDKTSPAYQLIRSVVMEEMVHVNLASNLLNAVGGVPRLVTENFPPRYPCYLSKSAQGCGPYLQLMAASPQLIRETFMKVEQPAQPDAPPQPDEFTTIGQFYKAIWDLFELYEGGYDTSRQSHDWNFGNNGGTIITVADRKTAKMAISEIVEQGEGADLLNRPGEPKYNIEEPWGMYEYYGPRADGTYGPVLGTPLEMSHYFKFKSIADDVTPLPETYPMISNPSREKYANPVALALSDLFDRCYSLLVVSLEKALQGDQSVFFTHAVPVMRTAMPVFATQMMQTPIAAGDQHTSVDPTAGPAFNFSLSGKAVGKEIPGACQAIHREIDELETMLRGKVAGGASPGLLPALRKVRDCLPIRAFSG